MIDNVEILVHAGKGGNGCLSFRREKFIPRGGPDGGDGGDGGSVWLRVDESMNTLLHLSYAELWRAVRGVHGLGKKQRGRNGEDLVIDVPKGTVVWRLGGWDRRERELVADLGDTDLALVARGGRGGRGNAWFVGPTNREPLLAEAGEDGEQARLLLELRLVADVGIVGKPNAGKSTLLSTCSAARPKVAEYPFTTLDPVLGVAEVYGDSFVLMEVPGLVEGAHLGVGLGHRFLQHTQRVRVLWHILDGTSDDLLRDLEAVNSELQMFDSSLLEKQQIVVINKADIPEVRARAATSQRSLESRGSPVHVISAATGEGVSGLLAKTLEALQQAGPEEEAHKALPGRERVRPRVRPITIDIEDGAFVVNSSRIARIAAVSDLRDPRAVNQLWNEIVRMGIDALLEEKGVQPGDLVRVGKAELEWK